MRKAVPVNILNAIAVEMPCEQCGGRFHISLGQILVAQEGMRTTCNARGERECPAFYYAGLVDPNLCEQLMAVWQQIQSPVEAKGGQLVVITDAEAT